MTTDSPVHSTPRPSRRFPIALLLCVVGILTRTASAQTDAGPVYTVVDEHTLRFELSFPEPRSGSSASQRESGPPRGFDIATIPGLSLPAFSTELAARATSVTVEALDVVEVDGASVVVGSSADIPFPERGSRRDAPADSRQGPYPAEWAVVGSGGRIGSVDLSNLTVHPYRFDARRGRILWARRMVVRVTTAGADPRSAGNMAGAIARSRAEKARRGNILSEPVRSTSVVAPDGFEYKIYTDSSRIYRVTAADLRRIGVPIERIDTRTLALYRDGLEVPIHISDRADNRLDEDDRVAEYFEFFGERPRARRVESGSDLYGDPAAEFSVYFLSWGGAPGRRLVEEGGDTRTRDAREVHDLTSERASFRSTVHLEENRVPAISFNSNLNTLSDRFDRMMWGHIPANAQVSFLGTVPSPDLVSDEPLRLTVALRGSSGKGESRSELLKKNHTAEIFIGSRRALQVDFKGDTVAFASTDSNRVGNATGGWLSADGTANISLINRFSAPTNTGSTISLNWIDITYQRLYSAHRDRIDFSVPQGLGMKYFRFRLRGFTSPDVAVYRNGISRITNVSIVQQETGEGARPLYDALFQVYAASSEEKFTAVAAPTIRTPILTRDSSARLVDPANAADYLVIVDDIASDLAHLDDASHPLRRFVEQKRSEGFSPRIVRAVDIYDEFSGGRLSADAFRDFLRHAYTAWARAPRYALIFGNGTPMTTEDMRSALDNPADSIGRFLAERSYVPTIYFQTIDFGATPCDYLLGCIAGRTSITENIYEGGRAAPADDFFPEVLVGRVNVLSRADIAGYVDKMIDQMRAADNGAWRTTTEFIGGSDPAFFGQIDGLIDRHYRSVSEPHRIYVSPQYGRSAYGDIDRIVGVLSDPGAALVTYMGHGGGGQWEDAAVLNSGNVYRVKNAGRMGTVLSYTCFTGAYSARSGLLSAMMIEPESGAISALGTAGLGWLRNNGLLAEAVSSVMLNPRYRGLGFGEIIALAKARYIGINGRIYPDQVPSVAAMYSIYGDPSLPVPLVRDTVVPTPATTVVAPGGTMRATVSFPFAPVSITLSAFDSSEVAYLTRSLAGARVGEPVAIDATVPAGYAGSYAGLRVHATGEGGRSATGSIRFSTSAGSLVSVTPATRLAGGSDASFELRIAGPYAPDSVTIALDYHGVYAFSGRRIGVTRSGEGIYRTDVLPGSSIEPGARLTVAVAVPQSIDGITTFSFIAEGGADPAGFRPVAEDTARARYGMRADFLEKGNPNETIRFRATPEGARLSGTLYNWGESEARDVAWSMAIDSSGTLLPLASGTTSIAPRDSSTVDLPIARYSPREQTVVLSVHPPAGDHWKDAWPRNNRAYNAIALAAGLFREGAGFVGAGTSGGFDFMPAGRATLAGTGTATEGIVTATILSERPQGTQPWRFVGIGDGAMGGAAIRLDVAPAAAAGSRIALTLSADTLRGGSANGARIVRYNASTRLWLAMETAVGGGGREFTATVPAEGIYALALSSDEQGPEVRFSVEGQFYSDSAVVPPDSRFSVVIYDPSGIDTDADRLHFRLDGVTLAVGSDYVILDSSVTPTTMNLRLLRTLTVGGHTLEVETVDRLGNRTVARTAFSVESETKLIVYGNYPNPFDVETFIAYELRGAQGASDIELVFYTTAGRTIRTMAYPASQPTDQDPLMQGGTGIPTAIGYHEAWWDGRDQLGVDVANGVYFYRLRLHVGDEELEQLGTIVRIR